MVVVVKTEDEACGGPLRFYPLRPDELIDAGNRTKLLDVLVSPAIDCESGTKPLVYCLFLFEPLFRFFFDHDFDQNLIFVSNCPQLVCM